MTKFSEKAPIDIHGVTYPTAAHAAVALDVLVSSIRAAALRGDLDSVGIPGRGGRGGRGWKPVTVDGVTYPSRDAAEKAHKWPRGSIKLLLARNARGVSE